MLTLGEELLLVALDAGRGELRGAEAMQIGVNAAGLAELLALGLVGLRQSDGSLGVTVRDPDAARADDHPLLAKALRQARDTRPGEHHPERCLRNWVSPSVYGYLESLRRNGILNWDRPETRARYGRFHLLDPAAAAAARARIERVATGAGPSERDLDLAGIAHGLGIGTALYKGIRGRSKREALTTALAKQRFAILTARAVPVPTGGVKFSSDSGDNAKAAINLARMSDGNIP